MPAHRASLGLALALLPLACGRPNPAFELAIETLGASATGGVTGSSGDTPTGGTTGVAATSGGASHSGSSGSVDGSSTTGDATLTGVVSDSSSTGGECLESISPGKPCGPADCCAGCSTCQDGTCIPDPGLCGACEACDGDGVCIPKPERAPCELVDDPCAGTVWGLQEGTCLAAKSGSGVCQSGECITAPNCEAGEPIVVCDVGCILDPGQCTAGALVDSVDEAKLCVQDGETPACGAECLDGVMMDTAVKKSCLSGECTPIAEQPCGNYACEEGACNQKCESQDDCKPPHFCKEQQCM